MVNAPFNGDDDREGFGCGRSGLTASGAHLMPEASGLRTVFRSGLSRHQRDGLWFDS